MPNPPEAYDKTFNLAKAITGPGGMDSVTAFFPYNDDPRHLVNTDASKYCFLRFVHFCRCARELGEEDVRCKWQYFRSQTACLENDLNDYMEHRKRGTCPFDILPEYSGVHMKQ